MTIASFYLCLKEKHASNTNKKIINKKAETDVI